MEQKKCLHLEICADFREFWGGATKTRIFITKSVKKQFLITNSGVITSLLRVSGLKLHFSGTEAVTFFGAQSSLGRRSFFSCLGGTSSGLGGDTAPECSPCRRACCKFTAIYRTVTNAFSLKRYLLEIDFIEEMRTILGNKEVPQIFFHNILYLRKYDLIRLTPYHCQPCIRNFLRLQQAYFAKILAN